MEFSFSSITTRKYEVSDMSSNATRNQNTLSAVMTSIIEATNVLKKKPARPFLPGYSSK